MKRVRSRQESVPLMLLAPAVVAVLVALLPLWYLLDQAAGEGLANAWSDLWTSQTAQLLWRSLGLAVTVTALCVLIGTTSAFLVVRTDVPMARTFEVLLALPLAVPSFVAAFSWVSWFRWLAGFWGAVLVLTLVSYPFVYLPVVAALRRLDPAQEEVARSLGRSRTGVVAAVTLPQLRPAVAAGALLVALYVLSDFGAVGTMRYEAFTWVIYGAFRAGFDPGRAAVLSSLLVAVALLVVFAESVVRGRPGFTRLGSGAPRSPERLDLGPWRAAALVVLFTVLLPAVAFPVGSVTIWFLRGFSAGIDWAELATAAAQSLLLAVSGMVATMLMAVPLGILAARHRNRRTRFIEGSVYVTHALPGIVVALSLVFVGVNLLRPLYQSVPMVALAYAVLFLPLGVGAVRASVEQSPVVLEEVAHCLGAGRWRVLARVTLPLALPGLASGAALVLLAAMKELPATLLLHPTGTETLAMNVWSDTAVGRYASAAPFALALLLVAVVPAWLLARTSRSAL